ncbi:MAG: bifunctional [glutamate--ammonia ligase]-adenylyl-L-tyrosine phosphorylase/[glutamate--ammonia-ligase] adenylyltransferase [Burkholderiales bacterium]
MAKKTLARVLQLSRFARALGEKHPDWANASLRKLETPVSAEEIDALVSSAQPGDQFFAELRRARNQLMLRLITRDLEGLASLEEVMRAVTRLAETAITISLSRAENSFNSEFGLPEVGQKLLVVGMGKLGGGELNVSSDVDLVFVYPEEGETAGPRHISHHEYFTLLAKKIIACLSQPTADGFVFRVDARLRPYGESGPLVCSLPMLEEYFVTQGREWERYAWIKARVIGDGDDSQLMQIVNPFVYRRHLDFAAIDSMRELHAQIRAEAKARSSRDNIKTGAGGIREIEFIAQVFQLVRGGRDASLKVRGTLPALRQLASRRLLPRNVVENLISCYEFLRKLEHRLQYLDDKQTQTLSRDAEDRGIIALAMGYSNFDELERELNARRELVTRHFEQVFSSAMGNETAFPVWGGQDSEALETLTELGYSDPHEALRRLNEIRRGRRYAEMPERSRERLNRLMPKLIKTAAEFDNSDSALERLLKLVEAVSRREAYLAFLIEYPHAAQNVARLLAASPWVAEYLTAHPILLDELVDPRTLNAEPDWKAIRSELKATLDDIADPESQMDALRHFKQVHVLRLVAQDLAGVLPLITLSDHLSALADLALEQTLRLCWRNVRGRHREDPRFAIVAYGKLGGKELGYASDLDLIFLYDDDAADAPDLYARLAHRINTWLTSLTPAGVLYETDLRLRPSGASGLLVSSIAAFDEYQTRHAWVWEHQALTRARFVAGDGAVGEAFARIRENVLRKPRDLTALRTEIVAMRKKMLDAHPNASDLFDLKHDRGGIVDVEFIVQYLVLGFAHHQSELTKNIGNLALLKLAAKLKLIPSKLADAVHAAYTEYRQQQHKLRLQSARYARVPHDDFAEHIESVQALWKEVF